MSYPAGKPQLVIKDNNMGGPDHCALCDRWGDAPIGPAIFVEGTWDIVCDDCAIDIAPGLVEVVWLWEREEEKRFQTERHLPKSLGGENPFTQEPPAWIVDEMEDMVKRQGDGLDLDVWGEALR
jgi:hypothetical protein